MTTNPHRDRSPALTRQKLAPPPRDCEARRTLRTQAEADLRAFTAAGALVDAAECRAFLRWLRTAPARECRLLQRRLERAGLDLQTDEVLQEMADEAADVAAADAASQ